MAKKVANRLTTLVAVADELQALCEFDPPIKTKGKSEKDLEKVIIEAASQLTEDDEVSEQAASVFQELGIQLSEGGEEAAEEEEEEEEEEAPAPKAKKAAAPAKKAPAPAAEGASKSTKLTSQEKVEFFSPLIESGKYTAKQLLEKSLEKFPGLSESSVRTFLVDAKNPKYNKFPKLVQADEEGKLSFLDAE